MNSIQFHSILPMMPLLAIIAAATAFSIWLHRKERRRGVGATLLVLLRSLVIIVIGLLVLNPVKVASTEKPAGKPPILVLVDTSHSMAVQDEGGKARIDAIRNALFSPAVTAALSSDHTLKYFEFSKDAVAQSPSVLSRNTPVNGTQTLIGESIAKALSSATGAKEGAVVVLSDGRDNGEIGPAEVARQARTRGFPVYTVCVGNETKTKDLSVSMNRSQVFTSPDQVVSLTADVASSGFEGVPATVRLLRETAKVEEKTVSLRPGGHTEVAFSAKEAEKGTYRYSVEVVPLAAEITKTNNRASTLLTVGNATTQVLVLEGKPTWEAKFLIQALRSDPSLSVDSIFQLTSDRSFAIQGVTSGGSEGQAEVKVPKTEADFAKYDVVMIGKGFEEFCNESGAKELQKYVSQDGGHLVFLRGEAASDSSSLAALEPVTWDKGEIHDFRMKVTSDGASNPAFGFGGTRDANTVIERLPTLISATRVAHEKALAVVLARATGSNNGEQPNREMAVMAYQRYGDGLVLSLIGQGLWRWALLPPELSDYTACYTDFWTQLVRWMVNQSDFLPGQNLALRTDHSTYSPGEAVNLMAFVKGSKREALSSATITGPDGKTSTIAMSKGGGKQADYVASFRPKVAGDYVATVSQSGSRGGKATAPFSVFEQAWEDLNTSADPGMMRRIAEAGGGKMLPLSQLKSIPKLLNETNAWFQKKPEPQSLWDRWEVLALILGMLAVEWFVRRRIGLV